MNRADEYTVTRHYKTKTALWHRYLYTVCEFRFTAKIALRRSVGPEFRRKSRFPGRAKNDFTEKHSTAAVWLVFPSFINQLSDSEESEGEAEKNAEKKGAHPSERKYVPPKIAAVHYGNVIFVLEMFFIVGCAFMWKLMR